MHLDNSSYGALIQLFDVVALIILAVFTGATDSVAMSRVKIVWLFVGVWLLGTLLGGVRV